MDWCRQQAIARGDANPDLCRHLASLDNNVIGLSLNISFYKLL